MSRLKNLLKSHLVLLHRTQNNYNFSMFEFLKKPLQPAEDSHTPVYHEVPIESSDDPHGEDVGQIAVDILETHE